MAQKPDIQYIHQFYVPGSEAQVIELKPVRKQRKTQLPQARPQEKIRIAIDPLALCGILVAVTMLVLMGVGLWQYRAACLEYVAMSDYVIDLQNQNVLLTAAYEGGYDLEDIQEKALGLGMIPISEATIVTIHPSIPEVQPEPTFWENVCWYFDQLFA